MAKLADEAYNGLIGPEESSTLEKTPPQPAMTIGDRRVDVLLTLHNSTKADLNHWEERIFRASMLTAGAMISVVAFFFQQRHDFTAHRGLMATAIGLFGLFTWIYLVLAVREYGRNGRLLAKLEAALSLCEKGQYLMDGPFFGYSGRWLSNYRAMIILFIHFVVLVFTVVAVGLLA